MFIVGNIVISVMPLQKAAVLFNTNTIFTVLLGICFLGEIPTTKIILLVFMTFFGVILLIDPSMIGFGEADAPKENSDCKILC
jgi:drug/metabolite transporter (DMT)-like permease